MLLINWNQLILVNFRKTPKYGINKVYRKMEQLQKGLIVLVDWVSSIKTKYSKIKNDMGKTGGGPFTNIQLNPQEERLMAIKGLSSVEGDGETPEMGLPEVAIQSIVSRIRIPPRFICQYQTTATQEVNGLQMK
ncbi:hypothetical protein JTB14_021195 [Gonioctena quinquepunctata]|nr:hypothetical protein JTB14_021195 [Gonioctena quinquepunctata]